MSQGGSLVNTGGGGGGTGTVTSVSGGTNITISGTPTVNPIVSVSGPPSPTTFTANGVLFGNTTGPIQATAAGATNTVLLGNGAGSPPSFGTVPNAALTNSTLSFTNVGGLTVDGLNTVSKPLGSTLQIGFGYIQTSTSGTASPNNGFIITAASTVTLPPDAVANQSDKVSFIVDTASAFVIQASPGQTIRLAGKSSTVGGTLTNTSIGDSIELIYLKLSLLWIAQNANAGWNLA